MIEKFMKYDSSSGVPHWLYHPTADILLDYVAPPKIFWNSG